MRKKIKSILAIGVAASFALSCASQCFGASNLKGISLTGTINQSDTVFNVSLPTDVIVLKPSENDQILTSASQNIENKNAADGSADSISYDVALIGYTITAKSASSDSIVFINTKTEKEEYTGTSKYVYLAMQIEEPGGNGDFSSPAIDQVIYNVSSKDYSSSNTGYSTLASNLKITVKPGESAPFRVTGTANPNAEWAAGDQVNVVPVFKVNANLTAD